MDVNLVGTYRVAREALRSSASTTIINIASMSAYQYFPNFSSYASSKAAVVAMTKCLSEEGVKAYSICPGGVDTKFRKKISKISTTADMLNPSDIGEIVRDILNGKYANGSSILTRKNDIFEIR